MSRRRSNKVIQYFNKRTQKVFGCTELGFSYLPPSFQKECSVYESEIKVPSVLKAEPDVVKKKAGRPPFKK